MVKCEVCGREEILPYKCNYCGKRFCSEHHLPENHNCVNKPREAPPYIRAKTEDFSVEALRELERARWSYEIENMKKDRIQRFKKKMRLPLLTVLFALIVFVIFFVPNELGHNYLQHIDFFRFHLVKSASLIKFVTGTGWMIFGPILIPLTTHGLIPCLAYYGGLTILILAYKYRGWKGIVLTLVVLFIIAFLPMEHERLTTRDFQTREELIEFLYNDSTNFKEYTSSFTCIDFSLTLIQNAKNVGYRLYFDSTENHAFCEAYIISEKKWLKIEPQTDWISG